MPQYKPNTPNLHRKVRHPGQTGDRLTSPAPVRQFAHHSARSAKGVSEQTEAPAEKTTEMLKPIYSAVSSADFNRLLIEIVRANTKASFDFIDQMLGVKSPAEFVELSSAHARNQFETFAEQSKQLTSLAQKVTHEVEPLHTGMKGNKAA